MKKTFYAVCILVLLLLSGTFVYKEYFIPIETNPGADVNVSEYTITVATNAGTVVDYVEYGTISVENYAIETLGFNRQFVQLSIYNTETEEQLQNNSAIEIGDELNIHIAIPEGYRLNAFRVNGYYANNDYLYTVTGNTTIYVDIERIVVNFSVYIGTEYGTGDYGYCNMMINSNSYDITLDNGLYGKDYYFTLFYGDILTFDIVTTEIGILSGFIMNGYMYAPIDGRSEGTDYFDICDYRGVSLIEYVNPYSYTVTECYSISLEIYLRAISY